MTREQKRDKDGKFAPNPTPAPTPVSTTPPQKQPPLTSPEPPSDFDIAWKRYTTKHEHQTKGKTFTPQNPLTIAGTNTLATPNGCKWCGREERSHGVSYSQDMDRQHIWEPPTNNQRKQRLLARRNQNPTPNV